MQELTFPEIELILLNCLPRPPSGVLHIPQVISSFNNTRESIQINSKKDNYFYHFHADGLSPLISISKCNSVIYFLEIVSLGFHLNAHACF